MRKSPITSFRIHKYFGIEELSATDNENIRRGKDSIVDRTRRLFYVCCSRAVRDLAVVFFVPDVAAAVAAVRAKGFFELENVLTLDDLAI
jgi:DNA helicase-2/ATP-dependent DNA helicase PcrA